MEGSNGDGVVEVIERREAADREGDDIDAIGDCIVEGREDVCVKTAVKPTNLVDGNSGGRNSSSCRARAEPQHVGVSDHNTGRRR